MAESLTLTTPVLARTGISVLRPSFIGLDILTGVLTVRLLPWNGSAYVPDGRALEYTYDATTTPTGVALINSIGKANLSTNSLWNRLMTQIKADHPEVAGTITGAPD